MLSVISPDETIAAMRRCLIDKWENPMNFDRAVLILLSARIFHVDHIAQFTDQAFAQAKRSLDTLQAAV